jgi:hypothetical protein
MYRYAEMTREESVEANFKKCLGIRMERLKKTKEVRPANVLTRTDFIPDTSYGLS